MSWGEVASCQFCNCDFLLSLRYHHHPPPWPYHQGAVRVERASKAGLPPHPNHTLWTASQHQRQLLPAHLHHIPSGPGEPGAHDVGRHRRLCHHSQQGRDAASHLLQGGKEHQQQHGEGCLRGLCHLGHFPGQLRAGVTYTVHTGVMLPVRPTSVVCRTVATHKWSPSKKESSFPQFLLLHLCLHRFEKDNVSLKCLLYAKRASVFYICYIVFASSDWSLSIVSRSKKNTEKCVCFSKWSITEKKTH